MGLVGGEVELGRAVDRELAIRPRVDEDQAVLVRVDRDRLRRIHREVPPHRGYRVERQRVARPVRRHSNLDEQPGEARHDRVRHDEPRVPVVRVVPIVPVLQTDPGEVRTDAPRRKEMREVERVLPCLGDRPPADVLPRDGAHVLAVAVPAPLSGVDTPAQSLERGIVARFVPDPLDLAQVGSDGARHPPLMRRRDHLREKPLDEERRRNAGEARADGQ